MIANGCALRHNGAGLMRSILRLIAFSLGLFFMADPAFSNDTGDSWTRGAEAFRLGRFEAAVAAWTSAAEQARTAGDRLGQSDALARRADAMRQLGRNGEALADLGQARMLARDAGTGAGAGAGTGERLAAIDVMIGDTYLALGAGDRALAILTDSLGARGEGGSRAAVAALNGIGTLLFDRKSYERSLAAYLQGRDLARRLDDPALDATLGINAARVLVMLTRLPEADAALAQAAAALDRAAPDHRKAFLLVAYAGVLMTIQEASAQSRPDRSMRMEGSLRQAFDLAEQLDDRRTLAQAAGRLAMVHERQGRIDEAQALTARAIFLAQETDAPELLFRLHWQAGRLLARQGDLSAAIRSYERAVKNLQRIRPDLSIATGGFSTSFREAVGPVFMEFTDLLLRRAPKQRDPAAQQADLVAARDVLERFKAAELEDYFQDDCVASIKARTTGIDRLEPHTAALYPILLPDRAELLLSLEGGLKQVTVPVGSAAITEAAHRLRPQLERRTVNRFLPDARQLYDWLVLPLEGELAAHGIDTLVIVPDGPLRGVPFAALHDGKGFLVERFAVAVTPGLNLIEPRPLMIGRSRLLLAGLTDPVQGFPALPYVADELNDIERAYGGELLENQEFRQDTVRDALAGVPYSVIHIASHGKFESEARDSFLLTYDGRLTMDELERLVKLSEFRQDAVELLTLSACQTAAGDDRATLGLAGIAIKAGARSALATLWFVNDQASGLLMAEFYRKLSGRTLSKAKALREAQLSLLRDDRYRHPGYWAPFLLIGNWL
jgi:CHAT domain-containing protein